MTYARQPMNSKRQTARAVFEALFLHARSDSLIALGSLRPNRHDPEPFPHYWMPLLTADRNEMVSDVYEWARGQTIYLAPSTFRHSALVKMKDPSRFRKAVHEYYRAAEHGKPKFFNVASKRVWELVAIVIDLDVGRDRHQPTASQALDIVCQKVQRRVIPVPGFVAFSGRGLYLIYPLREKKELAPPIATADNIDKYKECATELLRHTEDLASDHTCKSIQKWFKAPDTIDAKTGNDVAYLTIGDASPSRIPRHSLDGLADFLGLRSSGAASIATDVLRDVEAATFQGRLGKRKIGTPERKVRPGKGGEPYACRAREIESIVNYRSCIRKGLRHMTLLYYFQNKYTYFWMLYRSDAKRAHREAREQTQRLNADKCRPPLSDREFEKCVSAKRMRIKSDTIVKALKITQDEVDELGLVALVPSDIKRERRIRKEREKAEKRQLQETIKAEIARGTPTREITSGLHITRQRVYYYRKKHKQQTNHRTSLRWPLPRPRQKNLTIYPSFSRGPREDCFVQSRGGR